MFTQQECSKPEPNRDIDFDDYADLEFARYKEVHIHSIDFYTTDQYLHGFEIYYLVDGDVLKYVLHHRTREL